jgi:hypothetical protein
MAVEGWLELVTEHSAAGWACDRDNPAAHPTVQIHLGDRAIGEIKCEFLRPDLLSANIGTGDHGFIFNFVPPIASADIGLVSASVAGKPLPRLAGTAKAETRCSPQVARAVAPGFPPERAEAPAAYPVFVLGAARSGTTAMNSALARSTRYVGFEEGQFFDIIHTMLGGVGHFYARKYDDWKRPGTMIHQVTEPYIVQLIYTAMRTLAQEVFASPYWVDKTPNIATILAAPTLLAIWPAAKFVYMKRRGIENLVSRLRKFPPAISFQAHCEQWSQALEAWEATKPQLDRRWLEVDQREMLTDPEGTADRVGDFLGLPQAETAALAIHLRDVFPQRTAADPRQVRGIEEVGWTKEQVATFRQLCGPAMRRHGYGFGRSYFEDAPALRRA